MCTIGMLRANECKFIGTTTMYDKFIELLHKYDTKITDLDTTCKYTFHICV